MNYKKKYHFIGIGGVSMSALAIILKNQGHLVQGSDSAESEFTQILKKHGIKVFIGHNQNNIGDCDFVVYNSAISENNVEFVEAKQQNKTIKTRAEILQDISSQYKNVIAISGAHGKTTTTGMITDCLRLAGMQPTAHIGGVVKSFGSNVLIGKKDYFVTEACEYKNNFLFLKPTIGVVLNVEPEHLDFFGTFENVVKAFEQFSKNSNTVVMYQKVPLTHQDTILYGNTGYNARKIRQMQNGMFAFDCYFNNKKLFRVKLSVVGKHNIYNALATIAVCKKLGIADHIICQALQKFEGIKRRFDIVKEKPFIVHDYAHHPVEVSSVITATRNFRKANIIVAFQPHTFTRTAMLMQDFLTAFDGADELCVIKTYSAREPYKKTGSAKTLFENLKGRLNRVCYFSSMSSCYYYLQGRLKPTDTLLILGAGEIEKLSHMFKSKPFIFQK